MQYRLLNPERIIETQRRLQKRIAARFPSSGLSEVANELRAVAEKAAVRAAAIRRPHLWLRASVVLLLVLSAGLVFWMVTSLRLRADLQEAMNLVQFVEAALSASFFLIALLVFLITLEIRLKRRRALAALHELRALAHVIDMHQVTKDPEGILRRGPILTEARDQTTRTLFDLNRYLSYCSEMLTIISKIAALYIQEFPDAATVTAVDEVESLCSGLSHKIWQKIMILDRVQDDARMANDQAMTNEEARMKNEGRSTNDE